MNVIGRMLQGAARGAGAGQSLNTRAADLATGRFVMRHGSGQDDAAREMEKTNAQAAQRAQTLEEMRGWLAKMAQG